jgi:hypothetical protein
MQEPDAIDVQLTDPLFEDGELLPDANLDGSGMIPSEDGVLVSIHEETQITVQDADSARHSANLAEFLPDEELREIADRVSEWVEEDREARKEWEDCLKDGMQTLGISPMSADDRPFKGASTVTHPVIVESAIQFSSRAIEEFFPGSGPVKCKTIPDPDQEILDQAARVEGLFNFYLTEVDEGYYDDTDQMLFVLSLHGHAFRKWYQDPITGIVKGRYVSASQLLVPYEAKTLEDADHYTHCYSMTLNDIRRAQLNGHFRDVEFRETDFSSVDTSEEKQEKAMRDDADRKHNPDITDGLPEIYECHCELALSIDETDEIGGGQLALPYIVTVERNTNKVLAIYRNWDEGDTRKLKRVWFASYKYLQGLGFYGMGLFHILGNLAASSSAMLRAIIDAGALANLPGGFMAKQGGGRKGDMEYEPGVFKETDMSAEELERAFKQLPFKEPSQTLMLTMRDLIATAQRLASSTETMVGEGPRSGPVGTTLALIEQGSKVFTAIHKRMHRSLGRELKYMAKLLKMTGYQYPYKVPHSLVDDLDDRVDVIPVSDPTIVSNTQRIAMAQAAQQLIRSDPELYGPAARRAVDLQLMRVMKVPNAELLLKEEQEDEPPEHDPVTENALILTGKPIKAYPGQQHDAHIQTHLNFARALPPEGQKAIEGPLLAHLAEHAALKYTEMMQAIASQAEGLDPIMVAASTPIPPLVPQMMEQQNGGQ